MIPKEAIEKALKGGWNMRVGPIFGEYLRYPHDGSAPEILTDSDIVLDPSFWQALGKALGWDEHIALDQIAFSYAHCFYDLILTGGDTEEFWKDLLK